MPLPTKCKCGSEYFTEAQSYDCKKPYVTGIVTVCAVCQRKRASFQGKGDGPQAAHAKFSFKYAPKKGFGPQPPRDLSN